MKFTILSNKIFYYLPALNQNHISALIGIANIKKKIDCIEYFPEHSLKLKKKDLLIKTPLNWTVSTHINTRSKQLQIPQNMVPQHLLTTPLHRIVRGLGLRQQIVNGSHSRCLPRAGANKQCTSAYDDLTGFYCVRMRELVRCFLRVLFNFVLCNFATRIHILIYVQ